MSRASLTLSALLALSCAAGAMTAQQPTHKRQYRASVVSLDQDPLISFVHGNTVFQQSFNPSWIQASKGTNGKQGLVVRSQNCSAQVGGGCVRCEGSGAKVSVLTFSDVENVSGGGKVHASPITNSSIIFQPGNDLEMFGTEDPRVVFIEKESLYLMFYTCYGQSGGGESDLLCIAKTKTPLNASSWQRLGPVFPNIQGSKSAGLLPANENHTNFLFWGSGSIYVTNSSDPSKWTDPGQEFLKPRGGMYDSQGVEMGPPPLRLSTGDYVLFYNSWPSGYPDDSDTGFQVSYAILNGSDPTQILQRAEQPLLSPFAPWTNGTAPYTCNVPRVVFLEAATPIPGEQDAFRVFFGGADSTVGSAVVTVAPYTPPYSVSIATLDQDPVVSFVRGNTVFQQSFNPSWISPSKGTNGTQGLVVRSQNCSAQVGGPCVMCSGADQKASVLTFSAVTNLQDKAPKAAPITAESIIFEPESDLEVYGTEDPRIVYLESSATYLMFYTCYGRGSAKQGLANDDQSVLLCLASSQTPLNRTSWTRHGSVFPSIQGSKSAALLPASENHTNILIWGAGMISITNSSDPTKWPDPGKPFITTRPDMFDSEGVEAGPPPLKLSSGDYIFFYNTWNKGFPNDPNSGYQPAYAILNGSDPTQILQRAEQPLLSPFAPWTNGTAPYTCNVPRVVFLEAATPIPGEQDTFRVFFGGSDDTVGTATVKVRPQSLERPRGG